MSIEITVNAMNQYQERVKPALPWSKARRELITLVGQSHVMKTLDWISDDNAPHYIAIMELSDGVALTIDFKMCNRCDGLGYGRVTNRTVTCVRCKGEGHLPIYVATTVIVRGGLNEWALQRKRERQQRRRARVRMKRRKIRHNGRPEEAFQL